MGAAIESVEPLFGAALFCRRAQAGEPAHPAEVLEEACLRRILLKRGCQYIRPLPLYFSWSSRHSFCCRRSMGVSTLVFSCRQCSVPRPDHLDFLLAIPCLLGRSLWREILCRRSSQ